MDNNTIDNYTSNGYYSEIWNSGKRFNFAAFFVGSLWMFYRKMYAYAALAYIVNIATLYFITTSSGTSFMIALLAHIVVSLFLGFYGNKIYIKHSNSKINKIVKSSARDVELTLNKAGGTSFWSAYTVAFLVPLIAMYISAIL